MGTETAGITDVDISPAHGLLEITHDIQVADKFHGAVFGKLNSYFHSRHLLRNEAHRSRHISGGSWELLLPSELFAIPALKIPWTRRHR